LTEEAVARLRAIRIVPVITIDDPDDAVPLGRALILERRVVRRQGVSRQPEI
jgi:2-keto-3-deoxy-6-phosphogluconate aldolase